MLRLSVGIEDPDDLGADLDQALQSTAPDTPAVRPASTPHE